MLLLAVASLAETTLEFILLIVRVISGAMRSCKLVVFTLLWPHAAASFAALLLQPRAAQSLVLQRRHASAAMRAPRRRRTALHAEADKDECVTIKFVTGNAMKLREVEEILGMNGLP